MAMGSARGWPDGWDLHPPGKLIRHYRPVLGIVLGFSGAPVLVLDGCEPGELDVPMLDAPGELDAPALAPALFCELNALNVC